MTTEECAETETLGEKLGRAIRRHRRLLAVVAFCICIAAVACGLLFWIAAACEDGLETVSSGFGKTSESRMRNADRKATIRAASIRGGAIIIAGFAIGGGIALGLHSTSKCGNDRETRP